MKTEDFFLAIVDDDIEAIETMLKNGFDVNEVDKEDFNALLTAADEKNENTLAICKLLLKEGIQINAVNSSKRTALFRASLYDNFPIIRLLLRNGANPNTKSKDGSKAIDHVIMRKSNKCMLLFYKHSDKLDKEDRKRLSQCHFKVKMNKEIL